jgi:hypothetical protein
MRKKEQLLLKVEFKEWLIKRGNRGASTSYPKAISTISEHYSRETGTRTDIYSISNLNSISAIAHDYSQSGRFSAFGYEHHGRYRAAISRYAEFFAQRGGSFSSPDDIEQVEGSGHVVSEEGLESMPVQDAGNNFAYERDLQTSLCAQISELFPEYQIFGGGAQGIQYCIGGKRIDVLLEHRENNSLLAVELKSGEADFRVFGQISMYIGLLQEQYPDRAITGVIVAGAINSSLKQACAITDRVSLKMYRMYLDLEDA